MHSPHVAIQAQLPPIATLIRPPLIPGQCVYAMKYSLFARWVPAVVISIVRREENVSYYAIAVVPRFLYIIPFSIVLSTEYRCQESGSKSSEP